MSAALDLLAALGGRVLQASLAAALVGGGAYLLLRVCSPPPALRAFVWWLVAARVLAELAGAPSLELALLPAPDRPAPAAAVAEGPRTRALVVLDRDAALGPAPEAAAGTPAPAVPPRPVVAAGAAGRTIAAAAVGLAWSLLAGLALARTAAELAAARRRRTRRCDDPAARGALARAARRLGVRRAIDLRVGGETRVPYVVGLLRPVIVLPEGLPFDRDELEMTLAHELAHVRRRDALSATVPLLAERLFLFHPLVRLAAREFALATEAACDALVLARVAPEPERYGRLLLRFATVQPPVPPASAWPLARRPLERRLEMLARTLKVRRPALAALAPPLLVAAAIALPVHPVAAGLPADEPTNAERTTPAPAAVPAAPAPVATPGARAARRTPLPPAPPAAALPPAPSALVAPAPEPLRVEAPEPPPAPVAPVAPVAPLPPLPSYAGPGGELSLVAVDGEATISVDATAADRALARRLAADGEPVLVFRRRDGTRRVVRDRATIDAVREQFEREAQLAGERGRLAAEHGRLAARAAGELARAARRTAEEHRHLASRLEREMARLHEEMERLRGDLERLRVESVVEGGDLAPEIERGHEALERAERELEERIEREQRERGRRLDEILDRAEEVAEPGPPR